MDNKSLKLNDTNYFDFKMMFARLAGSIEMPLLVFLVMASARLMRPLGLCISGCSSSGKSHLLKYVLKFFPPEWVHIMSKASDAVLSKYGLNYFSNKIVIFEETDGLSDGAGYILRILMSEGLFKYDVTSLGRESSSEVILGPISLVGTTSEALSDIKEDNLNRVIVLEADQSVEQTRRVLHLQAESASAVPTEEEQELWLQYQSRNYLRSLSDVNVVIPFAKHIIPRTNSLQVRRDYPKILSLIETVVFLRQNFKKCKTVEDSGVRYLEADLEDYAIVYQLLSFAFKRTLNESQGLAEWYKVIKSNITNSNVAKSKSRDFTRKDIERLLGVGQTKAQEILKQLLENGAVRVTAPGRSNQPNKYGLVDGWATKASDIFVSPEELANVCSQNADDSTNVN